jgi:hypothetical protein
MGTTACSQPQPHDEKGEIHAMRLAVSQRVSSSSLLHWPSPACERCRSCKPRHANNSHWRAITPSECASTAAPTSRSFTLHRVHALPDTTSTEHQSIVYDGQDHRLERRCSSVPARGYKGAWRYISMGDHLQSNNAPPKRLRQDARSQPCYHPRNERGPAQQKTPFYGFTRSFLLTREELRSRVSSSMLSIKSLTLRYIPSDNR